MSDIRPLIVFDVDDTCALTVHRQGVLESDEYETESEKWDAFYDKCDQDKPNKPILYLLQTLMDKDDIRVELWTGRSESVREKTEQWFKTHLKINGLAKEIMFSKLPIRMRPEGDFRTDIELKADWVKEHGTPVLVFEDRNKMVKWWRDQGIECCQVRESDF